MKKIILLLLALAMISTSAVFAAPKELSVLWFYDDPSELDFLNKKLAEYSAANPGITYKVNTVAYNDLFTKLTQLVAGGNPPDVVKLTDIRPEFEPFVLDLSTKLGKDFLKPFIPGVAAAMYRGDRMLGAPLDVTANGILLNKSLFDKAGVAIPPSDKPWTWDQFLKTASDVKAKTGVINTLVWDVTPHRWATYLYENGGKIFDETGTKSLFNSPSTVQAFQGFSDMFKNGYIPKSIWIGPENPRDIFFSGQAVAWMSGSWQVKAMRDNIKNFDWTAGPNPYVTTRSSVLGYKFVSAFATGKNPDIAADFIKFFTGKTSNSQYAQALMTISARTDTGTINYGDAKATSALNNLALELAVSPLAASSDFTNAAMGYVNPLLKENVIDVILGKKTAQQAAKDVNDVIESALKATAK